MNKKTLREVIVTIKDDEVWENKTEFIKRIYLDKFGQLVFEYKHHAIDRRVCILKDLDIVYTLKSKKVAFIEAFKAYEEGKEIESTKSRNKYQIIDGTDKYSLFGSKDIENYCEFFTLEEIRGEWFINE